MVLSVNVTDRLRHETGRPVPHRVRHGTGLVPATRTQRMFTKGTVNVPVAQVRRAR
jgi:hypothetical protein